MIRNGVIDAQKEFAERRYLAETDRSFNALRTQVLQEHGLDIEIVRETYRKAQGKVFALVGDMLVNTYQMPPYVCQYQHN